MIVAKEFKDLQLTNFRLHMNFLLRKQQTAPEADTSCWSCLVASGSSTSYRVRFLLSSTSFAIYDATGILVFKEKLGEKQCHPYFTVWLSGIIIPMCSKL